MTSSKIVQCTLASLAILMAADNELANAQTEAASASIRAAVAVRAEKAPRLDGTLDDPIWQFAPPLNDFRQREPLETAAATEKTEVRILYDARRVYFGIHCYDTAPAEIVATQLRRDLSMDLDDNFAIMIDPTLSHRSGYIFQVNPLGTQRDGEVIEEQAPNGIDSIVDPSWDGLWISAAKLTRDGWSATIAIPFSTLNFRGGSAVTCGPDFRRSIPRTHEDDFWLVY